MKAPTHLEVPSSRKFNSLTRDVELSLLDLKVMNQLGGGEINGF